jgi:hypothetical protein
MTVYNLGSGIVSSLSDGLVSVRWDGTTERQGRVDVLSVRLISLRPACFLDHCASYSAVRSLGLVRTLTVYSMRCVLPWYVTDMVITNVSLKQKRPQLKKWGSAAVTASKTFVRATTGPRAGRRISRSLRQRASSDEAVCCKVNAASGINISWKCISTACTKQDEHGTLVEKALSCWSGRRDNSMQAVLVNTQFCHCVSSSYRKMFHNTSRKIVCLSCGIALWR